MKSTISLTLTFALVALTQSLQSQPEFRFPEPVTYIHNNITVGVLPRVELISIIQSISTYPEVFDFLMSDDSSSYRTEVTGYFATFRDHPAVIMFERLSMQPRMLNFSAPSNIMLYTDTELNLRTDIEPDPFVISRAGGPDSLNKFLQLVRDFAVQSAFNKFFTDHREFYMRIAETTAKSIGPIDYISELESFYGRKQRSYNIVLVSLYSSSGFGNSLIHHDGERDIFNTMGPVSVADDLPSFGDTNYLKYMIRHEFSHPFVNPLTEKHWDMIKDYQVNFESIPEKTRRSVCGDWQECINEFVIRAVTTHLAQNESEETGSWAYNKESSRGVTCLDDLLKNIKLYESDRNSFPNFDTYYPVILEVFKGSR